MTTMVSKKEILSMTISELIERTDINVKLGAKDGSAFVFCGNIGDIDCDQLDERITTSYEKIIRSATTRIKGLKEKPKTFDEYKREQLRKKVIDEKDIDKFINQNGYKRWLADIKIRIQKLQESKRRNRRKLDAFTTIRGRKIVDIYESCTEDGVYIVLYDGIETGSVWTTEEYVSGEVDFGSEEL